MIRIYFGKCGAGKSYYEKHDIEHENFRPIVSYTTRPARDGEVDGKDYKFVSNEEFQRLIDNHELLEFRSYQTLQKGEPTVWYYGSPKVNPDLDYVCVLDIEGIYSYLQTYGNSKIDLIYVYTPDKIREQRARSRGSFDFEEWTRRFNADHYDFNEHHITELKLKYGKPIKILNNAVNREVPC